MMGSRKYSIMCLCRYLAVFLLSPALTYSAEWDGKWFPVNPHLRVELTTVAPENSSTASSSPASIDAEPEPSSSSSPTPSTTVEPPSSSTSATIAKTTELDIENWTGKWFPAESGSNQTTPIPPFIKKSNTTMGLIDVACDNAKDNLAVDFDPLNLADSVVYVCFGRKHLYNPNMTIEPVLTEHQISPAYKPQHKCMDVELKYGEGIPTYGDHRPLWAKYGEYKYVPPQRWLHNIEHGAIVMLYHPCANFNQVEQLKLLVKYCIYRHVISPSSELLTPERPLALVAWGKSLEMSVVVPEIIVKFIRENALRGPEQSLNNGQYEKLLINHADVVSTVDDSVLCPNNGEIPII